MRSCSPGVNVHKICYSAKLKHRIFTDFWGITSNLNYDFFHNGNTAYTYFLLWSHIGATLEISHCNFEYWSAILKASSLRGIQKYLKPKTPSKIPGRLKDMKIYLCYSQKKNCVGIYFVVEIFSVSPLHFQFKKARSCLYLG